MSACKQSFAIGVVVVVNGNDNSPAVLALVLALTSFTVEISLRMFASTFSSLVNCLSLASWEGSAEGEASEGSLPLGSMTASAVRFFKRNGKKKREREEEEKEKNRESEKKK